MLNHQEKKHKKDKKHKKHKKHKNHSDEKKPLGSREKLLTNECLGGRDRHLIDLSRSVFF